MAKIMLVEDDNNLRQIYEDRLAAEGYTIVSANDGEEALAMAIKEKPDLIIADIMMPKVSGFDMLDILRSTPETKDTKIIMMTALSQSEDKTRAEKLGADRYLVKSQVTLEDVANVAAEMLNQQKSASDAAVSKMAGDTSLAPAPSAAPAVTSPAPTTASIPISTPPATPEPPMPAPTPALSAAPEPEPAAAPAPPPPMPAPVPEPPTPSAPTTTSIPIKTDDDDQTTAPTPAPATGEDTAEVKPPLSEDQSAKVAQAVDGLMQETGSQEPAKPADGNAYVSAGSPSDELSMNHTKVLEPTADVLSKPPNLNDLMAKEGAQADASAQPPQVSSIISPTGGASTPPPAPGAMNDVTPPPDVPGVAL